MPPISKPRAATNRKSEDWIGQVFGRMTITTLIGREGPRNSLVVEAVCVCGNTKRIRADLLRDGGSKSCGCLRDEINHMATADRPRRKRNALSAAAKEAHRIRKLAWVRANPKSVAAIAKRAREKDPEKRKASKAAEYQRRKGKAVARLNQRYATEVRFRIEMLIRGRIRKLLRLRKTPKADRALALLGCSIEELVVHLEKQFVSGMSWDNRSLWHVDHIRPCSTFDLTDPEQQKACFHFLNLQPLWGADNLRKSNKWTPTPSESEKDIPVPGL